MGSDESQFNVSLSLRDKVTRRCPQTATFELKRAEAESNRGPSVYHLTLNRLAKPASKFWIILMLSNDPYLDLAPMGPHVCVYVSYCKKG